MRKILALACTLFGLFVSIYLWWVYADPNHPMVCMTGNGCDEVRASRFAHWFGIPTPAFGALMYGSLVLLLFAQPFVMPRLARWIDRVTFSIAAAGVAFSLFLSYLSEFVIHAWCSWCVMQACAIGATFFLLWTKWEPAEDAQRRLVVAARNSEVVLLGLAVGIPMFLHLSWSKEKMYEQVQQSPAGPAALERLIRSDSHITGSANPDLTIVEFGDFQCPSCIIGEPASEEIRQRYGDRVKFVFREFPMPALHQYAQKAAEAAECAADQGRFWEAVQRFYAAEGDLGVPKLKQYAAGLGLDTGRFNGCLEGGAMAQRVAQDVADGLAAGVNGTPTFFLNGQKHPGPLAVQEVAKILANTPASSSVAAAAQSRTPSAPSTPAGIAVVTPSAKMSPTPVRAATQGTASRPTGAPVQGSSPLPLVGVGGSSGNANLLPGSGSSSAGCDVNATANPAPAENEIATADAKKLHDAGAQFVDIRSKDDFAARHIPGAVNMPLTQVGARSRELPRNKAIVVYESGLSTGDVCGRSRAVAGILTGMGLKEVKVYRDGLAGWEKQNLPVTK